MIRVAFDGTLLISAAFSSHYPEKEQNQKAGLHILVLLFSSYFSFSLMENVGAEHAQKLWQKFFLDAPAFGSKFHLGEIHKCDIYCLMFRHKQTHGVIASPERGERPSACILNVS